MWNTSHFGKKLGNKSGGQPGKTSGGLRPGKLIWRALLVGSVVLVGRAVFNAPVPLAAQAREEPYVRFPGPAKREQQAMKNLSGQVVSGQQGVAQAVVHLKNKKTSEVRTRIAGAEGRFVIRGLDRDTDYEVHAEFQGAVSDSKNVSSFDDRDEIQVTLELRSGN